PSSYRSESLPESARRRAGAGHDGLHRRGRPGAGGPRPPPRARVHQRQPGVRAAAVLVAHEVLRRPRVVHHLPAPPPRPPPRRPAALPGVANDGAAVRANAPAPTVTWIGHATLLFQLDGVNVLTDPQWSNRASPVAFAGPKRVTPPGLAFDDLPPVHVVLIS